jgi:hypothetical protein
MSLSDPCLPIVLVLDGSVCPRSCGIDFVHPLPSNRTVQTGDGLGIENDDEGQARFISGREGLRCSAI